jgi:hypothetical protein
MRNKKIILVTTLIICVLCYSCKKDEDTIIPQIIINSPNEFRNYKINDTVNILANVIDNKNISLIEIVIVSTDFIPVSDRIILQPNVKEININEFICIDDFNLNSGIYYVKVRASDGENEKNLFRAINIEGIQREFKGIISINKVNSNLFNIYYIDSVNHQIIDYSGDYVSSEINQNYQQLYICGNTNSNLNAYELKDNSLAWSILPDNNPPFPSFENLYFDNDILFVSCSQSYIVGYNRFSNINFNATTNLNFIPKKTIRIKNYLIVEEKSKTSSLRLLNVYYFPTGSLKNSTNLSINIKSMFYKNDDHIYIFGNDQNNNAAMSWFSIENQTYYNPHLMPVGKLNDVVKVDNTNYLLSIGNNIYWYQESTNSLTLFISDISAENIEYEDISQTIILGSGNKLFYYIFPSAIKKGEYNMQYTISQIHLLYNKKNK